MPIKKDFSLFLLISLCIQHAFFDLVSVYVVLSVAKHSENWNQAAFIIFTYIFFAFATQWVFGLIIDKKSITKHLISIAYVLLVIGLVLINNSLSAVIIIGLANSIFHCSAGSIVLRMYRDRAFYQGLFIAPGALGVMLGTIYSSSGEYISLLALIALFILVINIFTINPQIYNLNDTPVLSVKNHVLILCVLLLLLVIGIRSFVGTSVYFPWKSQSDSFVYVKLLFLATFIGKVSGGWLGDKWGLGKVGTISLLISAPLLYLGVKVPFFGVLGMMFFQMTTGITLALINHLTGYKEGLSFGLTTLFLFLGASLVYTRYLPLFTGTETTILLTVFASVLIIISVSLFKLFTIKNSKTNINI